MKYDMKYARERLKARRKQLKLTQQDLAQLCDVTPAQISHIETGKRLPTPELLINMCIALHVTPNYLFQEYLDADPIRDANKQWAYPLLDYRPHGFLHDLLFDDMLHDKSVKDYLAEGYALEDIPYGVMEDEEFLKVSDESVEDTDSDTPEYADDEWLYSVWTLYASSHPFDDSEDAPCDYEIDAE